MLLAEGATENWEQAQLAVKLILQGTETPSALLAALECADLPSALAYLHQDCELCASKFPEHEVGKLFHFNRFSVLFDKRRGLCPYCRRR